MAFGFVILSVVLFILADFSLRTILKRRNEAKLKKEREVALDIGLNLDYTDEAVSLKRVTVDNPKAKILAVDDEAVILDSFRKILVIAGYAVDTVQTGQEAIGLVRKNDYDFVFTDLKMPEMDGLDVTKAVKHLQPDIDVIMITGFATIETAVDAMKFGALDYVQKPFTEDELVEFVNKTLIRRQDKLDRKVKPQVHLVTASTGKSTSKHEFNVPAGLFVAPTHTWARIEVNGLVQIGIDDFAQKAIGSVDKIELPSVGQKVEKGKPLFTIKRGERKMVMPSPITGEIASVNAELFDHPEFIKTKPYGSGWICNVEPSNLGNDLQSLKIGADAVSWYQKEVDTFVGTMQKISTDDDGMDSDDASWDAFSQSFLSK